MRANAYSPGLNLSTRMRGFVPRAGFHFDVRATGQNIQPGLDTHLGTLARLSSSSPRAWPFFFPIFPSRSPSTFSPCRSVCRSLAFLVNAKTSSYKPRVIAQLGLRLCANRINFYVKLHLKLLHLVSRSKSYLFVSRLSSSF